MRPSYFGPATLVTSFSAMAGQGKPPGNLTTLYWEAVMRAAKPLLLIITTYFCLTIPAMATEDAGMPGDEASYDAGVSDAEAPDTGVPDTETPLADNEPRDETSYLVQPGDVLIVSVWKEPDLQREVLVRPDGGISFPLSGDMLVRDMSITEIRREISARLSSFIPDPEVSVSLKQITGNTIYVVGKVLKPGQIIAHRNMDVMQAIGNAGGFTRFADYNEIKILRRQSGAQTAIPFRYEDIEEGVNLEQNILLEPGDIVVVP
jgi:polysaccharide export outer membrane protein